MKTTSKATEMLTVFEVGKPYNYSRRSWPETNQFLCRDGQFELLLFYKGPTDSEVNNIRKGPVQFGLLPYRHTVFFLYRFGTERWADATFSWWLHPAEERKLPMTLAENDTESRIGLNIMLIGADDGLIKVIRLCSLSNNFTKKLVQVVHNQASTPWCGDGDYNATINAGYNLWPRTSQMVSAAVVKCRGGD